MSWIRSKSPVDNRALVRGLPLGWSGLRVSLLRVLYSETTGEMVTFLIRLGAMVVQSEDGCRFWKGVVVGGRRVVGVVGRGSVSLVGVGVGVGVGGCGGSGSTEGSSESWFGWCDEMMGGDSLLSSALEVVFVGCSGCESVGGGGVM